MAGKRGGFWQRHRWLKWIGICTVVVLIVIGIAANIALRHAEPFLRAHIVSSLQDRFHARVELDSFHMTLTNGLHAEGKGLRIWPPAQVHGVTVTADPNPATPLIRLDDFKFRAPLHYKIGEPFSITSVELKGLDIHIPPRSHFGNRDKSAAAKSAAGPPSAAKLLAFVIARVQCTDARMTLETDKPGKLPLEFDIANFNLVGAGGLPINPSTALAFTAVLTNPKPVGLINTSGSIGPWDEDDPGESHLQGEYTFANADLSTIKGIAGTLNSTGKYEGTLRNLIVDGDTDTPDFSLTHFGNKMPLHSHFHAKVDGTNGDTWLEPVNATLGKSQFTAQGQIVRVFDQSRSTPNAKPVSKGHDIALDVNMTAAHIEDFLRLASNSPDPLMTGSLALKAKLHIPPGPIPVHQRIELKGAFNLDQVHFSSDKIQGRITELSLRAQGHPKDVKSADADQTRSTMNGDFLMANGVIKLPKLIYTVPGADIRLAGAYTVDGGGLDFKGDARLDSSISKMVGGWKGFLLKPADRFFKKDGAGTVLPIVITGTRSEPKFGLEFGKIGH